MVDHMKTIALFLSSLSIILANQNQKLTKLVNAGVISRDQHECKREYNDTQPDGEKFDSKIHDFGERFIEIHHGCEPSWFYKCDTHYVMRARCTMRTTSHFIIAGISIVGLAILGTTVYYAVQYCHDR